MSGSDGEDDGVSSGTDTAVAGETTRERVFRVATRLFAENGYDATGVQQISEETGLGRGALYHHIKSKEQLLYEISMELMKPVNARAREIIDSGAPPSEQLRALARDMLRHLAEDRPAWTVTLYESRALSAERAADVLAQRQAYEEVWTEVLDRGYRDGEFQSISPLLRRGVIGFFNSTYLWIDASGPVTPEEVADHYVDFLLEGLARR
jgi:TetR/AcrR family transcriptional regulator, cholesterol catabolism regulator